MNKVESINKAIECTKNRDFKSAERIYLSLLNENPEDETILTILGLLYMQLRKFKKAEKIFIKAHKINKSDKILPHIAKVQTVLGKFYESMIVYINIVKNDNNIEHYVNLIENAGKCEAWQVMYQFANKGHELYPLEPYFIEKLAYASVFTGKYKEAEYYATKCLRQNSKSSAGLDVLGLLQEVLYCDEEGARRYYHQMIKNGDVVSGYQNLASSYGKEKRYKKKSLYYIKKVARLIKIDPFSFASHYLSQRQFKRGFRYYVIKQPKSHHEYLFLKRFKNRWDGKRYPNETLFVYGDQGIGDQLMFSRYLPFLQNKFKKIKVMVHPSLVSIFRRSFKHCKKIVKIYPNESKMRLPRFDKSIYMAFLPYYLNINFNHIPTPEGYMIPDTKKIEEYKERFFNTDKYKIGICWEAGAIGIREQIHRILNVELFEDIITNTPNAEIYSFQAKPTLDSYKKYENLIDVGPTFKDFDDTAGALKNLDLLLTVDTSSAHIAGALGVKTIMILPYCTDWRWFDDDETTDWYNSIRIVKQHVGEPWQDFFKRLRHVLDDTIAASTQDTVLDTDETTI